MSTTALISIIESYVFRILMCLNLEEAASVTGHVLESRSLGGPANKKKDSKVCCES